MKIALAFFGITRSLKYTIESIHNKIFKILDENHIEYDIFMHTYKLNGYKNIRTCEQLDDVDNEEYKLLHPTYFQMDDQDDIKNKINMKQYRSKPDPWNTQYNSVDNFILGQYSKSQLVKMIKNTQVHYDYVIYLRPDCLYLDDFNIDFFKHINDKTVCISNFHLFGKYNINDRFCITNMKTYQAYGDLFHELLKFSKQEPLHAETILGKRLLNFNLKIIKVKFNFSRVRCDGKIADKFD